MDAIFINSKNCKISNPKRLLLNLSEKINLKRYDKYVALLNLSIYYTWKNIKNSYQNNKFKISVPTLWRISVTWRIIFYIRIQDYYEYIFKKTCRKDW